ncbi:hypothetical protein F383_25306 [Gossypium arboreum]|uniref:Uncharacterized protein n=1 Tax=Gossypium arboreum TaxID=29729 RepID=A0A0B0P4A1_GOSAR|nr:hypothetical protein F383_25306 [Gossypium arboreum]
MFKLTERASPSTLITTNPRSMPNYIL